MIGMVLYCMAWSWIKSYGSKRDGIIKKLVLVVMKCVNGVENFMIFVYMGLVLLSFLRVFFMFFLLVFKMTICAFGICFKSFGMVVIMML